MSKTISFSSEMLAHILTNAPIAGVGDATGLPASAVAGTLFLSLHTADPGEGGNQGTSETTYAGYARIAVVRAGASWTLANTAGGAEAKNAIAHVYPKKNDVGTVTITHVGVGTAASGAGKLQYRGQLQTPLVVPENGIPELPINSITISES